MEAYKNVKLVTSRLRNRMWRSPSERAKRMRSRGKVKPDLLLNIEIESNDSSVRSALRIFGVCIFIGCIGGILYTIFTLAALSRVSDRVSKIRMLSERTAKEALGIATSYLNATDCCVAKFELFQLFGELNGLNQPLHAATSHFLELQSSLADFESSRSSSSFATLNEAVQELIERVHFTNKRISDESYLRAYCILGSLFLVIVVGLYVFNHLMIKISRKDAGLEANVKLMSQVCHEIKGHMAVVKYGLVEASEYFTRQQNSAELLDTLNTALMGFKSQESILANRLELHKLLSGNLVLKSTCFDLVSVIGGLIVQYQALSQRVEFLILPAQYTELWIHGDHHFMERALQNLINNSIKFTIAGKIFIKITTEPHLKISVQDTGCGIPEERQGSLFVSKKVIEDDRGTGMGLHFVYTIVNAMNGTVTLEHSEVGVGSTFTLEFPDINVQSDISRKHVQVPVDVDSIIFEMPNNKNVLIVDDQEMIRKLIKKRFNKFIDKKNWIFYEARHAEEAIMVINEQKVKFDIIIMDQNMESQGGCLKGVDALARLRGDGYLGVMILCSGDDHLSHDDIDLIWGKPLPDAQIMFEGLKNVMNDKMECVSVPNESIV